MMLPRSQVHSFIIVRGQNSHGTALLLCNEGFEDLIFHFGGVTIQQRLSDSVLLFAKNKKQAKQLTVNSKKS
jgi:hypothetical protein